MSVYGYVAYVSLKIIFNGLDASTTFFHPPVGVIARSHIDFTNLWQEVRSVSILPKHLGRGWGPQVSGSSEKTR